MTKAVRYDEFGGIEVLRVDEIDRPVPRDEQVLVRVEAAGINPGEAAIRTGTMADILPSTFPSGQGSDLAGIVAEVGVGVDRFSVGDEVIGFSEKRAAQAELVLIDVDNLTPKPRNVSWEVAGGLYVAGVAAWGGTFRTTRQGGDRCRLRRSRRGRLARCSARAPCRSHGHRPGEPVQPRVAAKPRRDLGRIR